MEMIPDDDEGTIVCVVSPHAVTTGMFWPGDSTTPCDSTTPYGAPPKTVDKVWAELVARWPDLKSAIFAQYPDYSLFVSVDTGHGTETFGGDAAEELRPLWTSVGEMILRDYHANAN
jgi:hypothetical protein